MKKILTINDKQFISHVMHLNGNNSWRRDKHKKEIYSQYGHGKEVVAIVNKIVKRLELGGDVSVREWINGMYEERLKGLAELLPDSGYTMGEMKVILVGKRKFHFCNESEYRGRHYTARHGRTELRLSAKDAFGRDAIGGLATKVGEPTKWNKGVRRCDWLEIEACDKKDAKGVIYAKGNKEIAITYKVVDGFIMDGYHARTIAEMKKYISKKRNEARLHEFQMKQKKVLAKKLVVELRDAIRCLKATKVTFNDSLMSGNCEAGTENFCRVLHLDTNGYVTFGKLVDIAKKRKCFRHHILKIIHRLINEKFSFRVWCEKYILETNMGRYYFTIDELFELAYKCA